MTLPVRATMCVAAWLLTVSVAQAQIRVLTSNETQTYDCKGGDVRVTGSNNQLTLRGECNFVDVNGSTNVIRIEAVRRIEVSGTGNRVTYARPIDDVKAPVITRRGQNNVVEQEKLEAPRVRETAKPEAAAAPKPTTPAPKPATPAPKPAQSAPAESRRSAAPPRPWELEGGRYHLGATGSETTLDCAGRNVAILGNSNRVTLTGECPVVDVSGNSNTITIANAGKISTPGTSNRVTWSLGLDKAEPEVFNPGRGNTIRKSP